MDVVYRGLPDWQFLSRFVSQDEEEIGWPFSVGEMVMATNRVMCAWAPYSKDCGLSLEFLSRNAGLANPRKHLCKLIEQAKRVAYEPPPWVEFDFDDEILEFGGMWFDTGLVTRFPRLKLVGIGSSDCDDGKTKALFVKWGHNGAGVILPRVPVTKPAQ